MRLTLFLTLFFCQLANAYPVLSVKERLRLHLWAYGLEEKDQPKSKDSSKRRPLPEELERAIRRF